jgi:peptidoglycan/LPS O-acetylase OafA/YrhL
MPAETPMPDERAHRPELDGLRGLAAYVVVVSHISNASNLWNGLLGRGGGQIGVMLFFVLSGYLMGALYLDRPFRAGEVWAYAVRRIARVVPLFYVVVTLALVFNLIGARLGFDLALYEIAPDNVFRHYALLDGVSVFWTIPVEMHFYLTFVFLWLVFAYSRAALIALLAGAIAAEYLFQLDAGAYSRTLVFFGAFFLSGVLISRLRRLDEPVSAGPLWSLGFAGCLAFTLLLFPNVYLAVFGQQRWLIDVQLRQMWHDPIYLAAASACLYMALASPLAARVLGNRFMVYSGKISYSVYLLHLPVIDLLARLFPASAMPEIFLLLAFGLTTAVASVSYYLIEAPSRRAVVRLLSPGPARSQWKAMSSPADSSPIP